MAALLQVFIVLDLFGLRFREADKILQLVLQHTKITALQSLIFLLMLAGVHGSGGDDWFVTTDYS